MKKYDPKRMTEAEWETAFGAWVETYNELRPPSVKWLLGCRFSEEEEAR